MEQSTAVAVRGLDSFLTNWQQRQEVAAMLIKSKFLPPAYTSPEQVIAVMLVAHELNVPEMEAIRGINVIQGKPTISPQLMLALINRSGQQEDMTISDDGNACKVTMKRKGRSPVTVSFSMQDATAMGLGGKDNWKKQGKVMRQWRAISACARLVFPDVISGMYTTEELDPDATITEEGEQISSKNTLAHETAYAIETIETVAKEIDVEQAHKPVVVDNKTVGVEFDPTKEQIGFGKNKGMLWAELPKDYLQWLSGNPGANKGKADATLKYLETAHAQKEEAQGDPLGSIFDDDPMVATSTKNRERFLKEIESAVKGTLTIVGKRVNACEDSGEILPDDVRIVLKALDEKSKKLHPPKKEAVSA